MSKFERTVVPKFERSCGKVRAKLCRSWSEVGANCVKVPAKFFFFAKFALKWQHNFRAYCTWLNIAYDILPLFTQVLNPDRLD